METKQQEKMGKLEQQWNELECKLVRELNEKMDIIEATNTIESLMLFYSTKE